MRTNNSYMGGDDVNLKLKFKRHEKNLTQKELAEIIGVTSQSVSDYERGKTIPNYTNMIKISEILDTPVSELFFDEKIKGAE